MIISFCIWVTLFHIKEMYHLNKSDIIKREKENIAGGN